MITVVITCNVKPHMVDVAMRDLTTVGKTVMTKEPACHGIHVFNATDNPAKLLIIEYWDSKEIFSGQHMETPHMKEFLTAAKTFLDGEAEFSFWNAH